MLPEERQEHEKRIREKDDADVLAIVVLQPEEYIPEVIQIAKDELSRRRLPILSTRDYWDRYPQEWIANVGFCLPCWQETTSESPGNVFTIHFIGTRFIGWSSACTTCGSAIKTKFFCVILPVIPLGRYRVIQHLPGDYIGRRMRPPATHA